MSGSGGFFKYRCKYFYTHNCPNWVYVNHSPCANCCAEGRENDQEQVQQQPSWRFSCDVFVPRAEDGVLHYTLMEIVNPKEEGEKYWTLRYKTTQPPATSFPVTSATPGAPILASAF